MEKADSYFLETATKTRNLGLVMSLILVPMMLVFVYIDHASPVLHGILGWRIGALIPGLGVSLLCAVPVSAVSPCRRLTACRAAGGHDDHDVRHQCRPRGPARFPPFDRTALISSLLVCIFADFVFAAGARKYLFAILFPPLAAMGAYIVAAGKLLTQTEQLWLISNPAAMAAILSVLALYQERASVKQFHARRDLDSTQGALQVSERNIPRPFRERASRDVSDPSRRVRNPRRQPPAAGNQRARAGRGNRELPDGIWADRKERSVMRRLLAGDGTVTRLRVPSPRRAGTRACLPALDQAVSRSGHSRGIARRHHGAQAGRGNGWKYCGTPSTPQLTGRTG